jgi:hypothetical protein
MIRLQIDKDKINYPQVSFTALFRIIRLPLQSPHVHMDITWSSVVVVVGSERVTEDYYNKHLVEIAY